MFQYVISIDKKIISILGPHLYGDMASIIAELISNSYDADADNCWVTIKTGKNPEIIIEDDGIGMTPKEVNSYFLDIGHDRRDKRPNTPKGRDVFGRKGIGKLAAFSLSKLIELYSLKGGEKVGCTLDYDKITKENKEPDAIPDEKIIFASGRLSPNGTGTRLVLMNIQKNINTTYYYLINKIVRNFNVDFDKFKIHVKKNDGDFVTVNYADLKFFDNMDTIVTIGDEYDTRCDEVRKNKIPERYKQIFRYGDYLKIGKKEHLQLPRSMEVLDKKGEKKIINFIFKGWIGTIVNKGELKGLIKKDGASQEEEESISINDNRITIFSRKRVGEYDVLPKVQSDTIYDAYVIGEIHVDVFEDNQLTDMAISNRRGYEETDARYQALLDYLKSLVRFIVQKKAEVNKNRKDDEDEKEADIIKENFSKKTQTMNILKTQLDESQQKVVADENFQFVRAAKLGQNTKKIMISHNAENKEYGQFIMRIFELLGMDVSSIFIFTSDPRTGVPHGVKIYDYLRDCFRDDIYVIFLFSRHFYDSNVCISETGMAWATNKDHSIIVTDIGFDSVDKPIDNTKCGLVINNLDSLNKTDAVNFIKAVYEGITFPVPEDNRIIQALESAITEYKTKVNIDLFCPKRKYQGHPVCDKTGCGNTMILKKDVAGLYYECQTPSCGKRINAKIQ